MPEPLGVALVIAPWNYPIQLLVEPLGAALAAGNCVLAKPSELAPACSAALARLLPRYVDPDAVVVVEGGVDETTALLAERWDHIFFTGSTAVGRVVAEAAAKHLTPTVLELGGKSPTYVHRSADLDVAARRIAWGKFLNAGQTCIAPDYVLVDHAGEGRARRQARAPDRRVLRRRPEGAARASAASSTSATSRACRACLDDGARAPSPPAARSTPPTGSSRRPSPSTRPRQRRDAGGDLRADPAVLGVDGPDEAKAFVTARPKPLALYVFAQQDDVVDDIVDATTSGGVCVNQTLMHILPADLPFGGVGDSGMGAYHGKAGFDAFSHRKSVLRKPTRPDLKLLYPPYKPLVERLVRKILR